MATDKTHTTHANDLFDALTESLPEFPDVDVDSKEFESPYGEESSIFKERDPLTIDDLTTSQVDGDGYFDRMMTSVKNHLREELQAGRIMGSEYTKAYIALTEAAMSTAAQFLLGKDNAYWQSVNAQLTAIGLNVSLAKARAELIGIYAQTELSKANYALTKLNIDKTNLDIDEIVPAQKNLLDAQAAKEWANTTDKVMIDGENTDVGGVIKAQKDLYGQQLASYKQNTINETLQPIFSSWSVGMTNAIPNMSMPSVVNRDSFHTTINGLLASLRTNTNWDEGNTIVAQPGSDENGNPIP